MDTPYRITVNQAIDLLKKAGEALDIQSRERLCEMANVSASTPSKWSKIVEAGEGDERRVSPDMTQKLLARFGRFFETPDEDRGLAYGEPDEPGMVIRDAPDGAASGIGPGAAGESAERLALVSEVMTLTPEQVRRTLEYLRSSRATVGVGRSA